MFSPNRRRKVPGINTSSLPDLIFTILFFFMIAANIRKSEPQTPLLYPEGIILEKNVRTQFSHTLYIGIKDGHEYLQLDDENIGWNKLRSRLSELVGQTERDLREQLSVSLGIDKHVTMDVVERARTIIKESGILRVNYIGKDSNED